MPQYYNSANASTAASEGLMAGFEFVDRIQSRRRALELEERQQERADRGMLLAVNADQRATDAATAAEQERIRDNTREDVEDERTSTLFSQQQSEFDRSKRVRSEVEGARGALAEGMFSGGPQSLSAIGANGTQRTRPATVQPNVRADGQSTEARDSGQPPGPIDLRASQRDAENSPGFTERLKSFVDDQREGAKTRNAESFWGEVANPKSTVGTAYHSGIGNSVPLREVRLDPAKYSDQYLKDRNRVPASARASLDLTMSTALREKSTQLSTQIAQLDPNDPKIRSLGNQLVTVNNHMTTLAKATTSSAAADAGITRPVKVDDARVVPAITNAAAKAREAQPILESSPDELRAASTVVNRIGGAKRLNEKQISAVTTLYAHGQIDTEQLNNWSKYGTPIAPKPPSIQALGGGYAAIVSEQGISIMALPGNAKGESASSRSNQRLLVNDRLKQINDGMKGMVEAGELSDGSPNQHMTKFLQIVKREAPNLQLKSGIPLLGTDGALNLAEADPGEVAELLSNYAAYDAGEEQPWIFKGGKTFTDYAPSPGGEEIVDLTSFFEK